MIFLYLLQDAVGSRKEVGVSRQLYSHLCLIAMVAAIIGVLVQLAVGGLLAGLIAGFAALLGFISGYRWHQRRLEKRRRIERDSG